MSSLLSFFRKGKLTDNDQPTPESSPAKGSKKVFSIGLKSLYEPESAVVDIIFVHGLTGGMERTWTSRNAVSPWPQILLPTKLPNARILTFGYDANVVDWRAMVSKNRVGNHAENLLTTVATYRENDNTNCRPILFVAHSLGGLVCEDALLASRNSAEKYLQNILTCTRGILFLGTPHGGSGLATWAVLLAKYVGLVKQTSSQIVEVLKRDSEVLERIQKEFHSMARARANNHDPPIAITCLYEELPLPGIGEVVPKNSAILPAYTSIGIHDNHMGMTKFEAEDDPGFKSVAGELQRWVRELKPVSSE
ncbi:hypothetical protein MMC22_003509 [Lobaria immixta]|nr:hypothetical protein [Lobaria immixta]